MIPRTRFLITAALLCHLLFAHPLVTSQLLSTPQSGTLSQGVPGPPPIARPEQEVRIEALEQEKDGPVYKLRGHVEIQYGTFNLYADEVTYNSDTGEFLANTAAVDDTGKAYKVY